MSNNPELKSKTDKNDDQENLNETSASFGSSVSDDFVPGLLPRTRSLENKDNSRETPRKARTSSENYIRRFSYGSISEEYADDFTNNNVVVTTTLNLTSKKKTSRSRDVYVVQRLAHHQQTMLSYSEEYKMNFSYGDIQFKLPTQQAASAAAGKRTKKSKGKHLTTIDVNENFASPNILESPPPMRRRFITEPATDYQHTPPEQLRNQCKEILSNNNRKSSSVDHSQKERIVNRSSSLKVLPVKNTARDDPDMKNFRRFSDMRQQVKKICKPSRKTSKSSGSMDRETPSPDSVFDSPKTVRSLTDSDHSFSTDSETSEIPNRIRKIQYKGYHKSNEMLQFDFEQGTQDVSTIRKHSPLSSVDSQYYGSDSSISSTTGLVYSSSDTNISALTSDMLLHIFSYLPTTNDVCRISQVCRKWYDVYLAAELWESITITNSVDLEIDVVINMLLQRLAFKTSHACLCVKQIRLDGCYRLTDNGIKMISRRCPELRSLEIASCFHVTTAGLYDVLTNCPNLAYLNAAKCEGITDFSLLSETQLMLLKNSTFGNIKYIDLSGCSSLNDDALRLLLKCTTRLEYLYLRQCDCISNVGLFTIAEFCKNLREVSLNDCVNITDGGVENLIENCNNIQYLSIAKCPISNSALTSIATFAAQIRHLNLYECDYITDTGIMKIASSCPRMRSIDLSNCLSITDASLYVLSRCSKMRRVNLKACRKVTDAGVRKLATHCTNLRHLDLRQCTISTETFLYVKRHCALCEIVSDDMLDNVV